MSCKRNPDRFRAARRDAAKVARKFLGGQRVFAWFLDSQTTSSEKITTPRPVSVESFSRESGGANQ